MKSKIAIVVLLIVTLNGSLSGCGWANNEDVNTKIPVMDINQNAIATGKVNLVDKTADQSVASAQIQPEEAKKIALNDAALSESEVIFQTVEYEYDDGIVYYEIDFYSQTNGNGNKYEYDINATDGSIISYSSKPIKSEIPTDNVLTEEAIREIVKGRAGITATIAIPLRLTREDGRIIYEGEFVYGEQEYEFEVEATSGIIVDWDVESIYYD